MSVNLKTNGTLLDTHRYDGVTVVGVSQDTGDRITLWCGEFHDQGRATERARELMSASSAYHVGGETYLPRYFLFHNSKEDTTRYLFQ